MNKKLHVLDQKASDNEYLHKDFHGALCYSIKYLDDNFGEEVTNAYLTQVGESVYLPLISRLKQNGLSALAEHWREIFTNEGGKFSLYFEEGSLMLVVTDCPAIRHLKKSNQFFTTRFCETTVVVNQTICMKAGYNCSCDYEPGNGKCIQKFWREEKSES
jgi:hypothetical protein